MKTFLLDIIPKIKAYSKKLDDLAVLINKNWVVIDDELGKKIVYIFREKGNQLLISDNGNIEKGTWEYLGNNSILIDRKDGSFLFKHGFLDDSVLALKVDGKDEYALLIDEGKFEDRLKSIPDVVSLLEKRYLKMDEVKFGIASNDLMFERIQPSNSFKILEFNPIDYPQLDIDLEIICNQISSFKYIYANKVIIQYCKNHSISKQQARENPNLIKLLGTNDFPTKAIEQLFEKNRSNFSFCKELEKYIAKKISQEI